MVSGITAHRRAFWDFFAAHLPDLAARTTRGNETTRWLEVATRPLVIAHYVSAGGVGLFVRGVRGERIGLVREFLFQHRARLAGRLGEPDPPLGTRFLLHARLRADIASGRGWPEAIEWFRLRSPLYERALAELGPLPVPDGDWPE